MITSFLNYIKKGNLFKPDEKVLLTVSGGIDSILLCELFHKAGLHFGIAHCNFQLRAEESDGDEEFVEALAEKYDVPFHCTSFNTEAFAKKNKLSTQVAARELRYQWFEAIREQYQYHYIATAHHQDDSIETFFINFTRGTGISGLHGILPKQGIIIRPMLFTAKQEIETYVKKHKLKYREDSSNASDKYVRNKIRHHVIPVLKELNPNLENTFDSTMEHIRAVELIYKKDIESKRIKIVKQEKKSIVISIEQLKKLQPITTYLYEFLKPFHFNASTVNEVIAALDGESGKQYFSASHRLIKDRKFLIIETKVKSEGSEEVGTKKKPHVFSIKKSLKTFVNDDLALHFKTLKKSSDTEFKTPNTIAALDFDRLEFPLVIRKWQQGDVFYPLGMKGKKKLSDFFIDKKLSLKQKENTWLLTSADKIVWVIGLRVDERFKITEKTQNIYFAELV